MHLNGLHAMVIEADANDLLMIGNLLNALGITCKRNTTGDGVMAQVRRLKPTPDFILLDVDLPQGDVNAICHELRNDPGLMIPVITIAEAFTPEMLAEAALCGVAACVEKPLPRHYMNRIISTVITEPHSPGELPILYVPCN